MMNLDNLLASLMKAAEPELSRIPLLRAQNLVQEGARTDPGHLVLGLLSQWLLEQGALSADKQALCRSLPADEAADINAVAFSQRLMSGELRLDDVASEMRAFMDAYVRYSIYLWDFNDVNVVAMDAKDLGEVVDDSATRQRTFARIDSRYQRFLAHDSGWNHMSSYYRQVELGFATRTEAGWLQALAALNLQKPISERQRRLELNVLWALIDCASETGSPQVLNQLQALRQLDLGEGVGESIDNALNALSDRLSQR